MNSETANDLIPTIAQLSGAGGGAALNRMAEKLLAHGVTRRDLQDAYAALTEDDGHAPITARKSIAAAIESGTVMSIARRRQPASEPTRGERERSTRTNTAHTMRMAEMQAEGIGRDDALRYEQGGYIHEGIVGDGRDPQDLARDHGLDPWDAVQLASAWAQRFNGGTDGLRRALAATVASCRACAKTMKGEAANDMLNKAERFARYLEGVAMKQPAQEATT